MADNKGLVAIGVAGLAGAGLLGYLMMSKAKEAAEGAAEIVKLTCPICKQKVLPQDFVSHLAGHGYSLIKDKEGNYVGLVSKIGEIFDMMMNKIGLSVNNIFYALTDKGKEILEKAGYKVFIAEVLKKGTDVIGYKVGDVYLGTDLKKLARISAGKVIAFTEDAKKILNDVGIKVDEVLKPITAGTPSVPTPTKEVPSIEQVTTQAQQVGEQVVSGVQQATTQVQAGVQQLTSTAQELATQAVSGAQQVFEQVQDLFPGSSQPQLTQSPGPEFQTYGDLNNIFTHVARKADGTLLIKDVKTDWTSQMPTKRIRLSNKGDYVSFYPKANIRLTVIEEKQTRPNQFVPWSAKTKTTKVIDIKKSEWYTIKNPEDGITSNYEYSIELQPVTTGFLGAGGFEFYETIEFENKYRYGI